MKDMKGQPCSWFSVLFTAVALLVLSVQGVPRKRGISECYSVCFTADLIWNLENLFIIHSKVEIHMFVPNIIPFLRDIRELRNKSFIIGFVCS